MTIGYPLRNRQSQSDGTFIIVGFCASFVRAIKPVKNFFTIVFWNTNALVDKFQLRHIAASRQLNFNDGIGRAETQGIFQEGDYAGQPIFITKDGTLVTPKSDSILPSITRRSICVDRHFR